MAAQERARLAEQKEKEAKAAAQTEKEVAELRKQREAETKAEAFEQERVQMAKAALRSAAGHALEDKQERILRELEGKPPAIAVPIMKSLDLPPPPLPSEAVKFPPPQQQQQQQQQQPPSFDFIEQQLMIHPPLPSTAPSPSAPTMTDFDHLEGILPVALPQKNTEDMSPPPSFTEFEKKLRHASTKVSGNIVDDECVFDFDLDGNPLTPEQRQAMMDEQRQLYEYIMREKAANDAAIAQASADDFDARSSNAAARAMASQTNAMDSAGRPDIDGDTEEVEGETTRRWPRRMVKIGNNQMVALHGQERTKKAIKEGTAILVQCINCQNWMQVTETATLMFCPVCQVVSPVIKQSEVLTKEEALQLTMDRKLAEKLQAEAYASDEADGTQVKHEEGYFARLFGGGSFTESTETTAAASAGGAATTSPSWWDKITSVVSYGVAEEARERGDLGVTRPPGASSSSSFPSQRRENLSPVITVDRSFLNHREETQGLLRPVTDGNEANLPAGRVADHRPLFSCVMDSVSNAASAVFSTGLGSNEEGNVHGVDASSLLTVTSAGRGGGDRAGDYSKLPDNE